MAKQIAKQGDRVFLPKLGHFGNVATVNAEGRITEVEVQTPNGTRYVETEEMEVVFAVIIRGIARWFLKLINKVL